jgi:hypothetical protein
MPQTFSCMQVWQMANPHRHRQQKVKVPPQQWQETGPFLLRPGRAGLARVAAGIALDALQGLSMVITFTGCCAVRPSMLKTGRKHQSNRRPGGRPFSCRGLNLKQSLYSVKAGRIPRSNQIAGRL